MGLNDREYKKLYRDGSTGSASWNTETSVDTEFAVGLAAKYTTSTPSLSNNNWSFLRVTSDGKLMVDTELTLSGVTIDNVSLTDLNGTELYFALNDSAVVTAGINAMFEAKTIDGAAFSGVSAEGDSVRGAASTAGVQFVSVVSKWGEAELALKDDVSFTPATSLVMPVGYVVDDTSTDSVDEGDIGAPRMSADRVIYVQGAVAHDAADSGNPMKIGGYASSSQRTAVASGDRVDTTFNLYGEQIIAGYDWSSGANNVSEIDPISSHHVEETLATVTNETSSTNYYYIDMDGYTRLSVEVDTSGTTPTDTCTITIEATNQDDGTVPASCSYVDITRGFYDSATGARNTSSWVDVDVFAWMEDINAKYIRIKTVTAGGSNDADYTIYIKKSY